MSTVRTPTTLLALLAAAVLVVGPLDLHQHYGLGPAAALGLSALRAAPLLLVRSRPLPAWAGVLAATVVTALPARPVSAAEPWPWAVSSLLAALPVLAVLGARLAPPALVAVWASVLAAGAGPLLVAPSRGGWGGLPPALALTGAALAGGHLVRGRADARRSVVRSDAEREVLRERARIARELHDVIAHGLSVVTVRADSAPHRLPDVPPAVAAEFAAIAEAARQSLTELRQVLGVLRDPAAGPDSAPLPGLADLPALTGDVPLTVTGAAQDVPPALQLTAYRLVQEALSNARRHAPDAAVAVTVAVEEDLRVCVDNGPGARPASPGRGYGLAGMRERAALAGGRLDAGPRPDGGWRVAAVLPLEGP